MVKNKDLIKKMDVNGFTMVEIIIVVAIIGILSSIAIPAYQNYISTAKLAVGQNLQAQIPLVLETYRAENGSFCPNCTTNGNKVYEYKEDDAGAATTTTLTATYPNFRPRSETMKAGEPIMYDIKLTIAVSNCATGCQEVATTAISKVSGRDGVTIPDAVYQ